MTSRENWNGKERKLGCFEWEESGDKAHMVQVTVPKELLVHDGKLKSPERETSMW